MKNFFPPPFRRYLILTLLLPGLLTLAGCKDKKRTGGADYTLTMRAVFPKMTELDNRIAAKGPGNVKPLVAEIMASLDKLQMSGLPATVASAHAEFKKRMSELNKVYAALPKDAPEEELGIPGWLLKMEKDKTLFNKAKAALDQRGPAYEKVKEQWPKLKKACADNGINLDPV